MQWDSLRHLPNRCGYASWPSLPMAERFVSAICTKPWNFPNRRSRDISAFLRTSGWVVARKEGRWAYYRLAKPKSNLHRHLIFCIESCLSDVEELKRDRERLDSLAVLSLTRRRSSALGPASKTANPQGVGSRPDAPWGSVRSAALEHRTRMHAIATAQHVGL